ncbi:hypothetical protein [Vibrio sp. WXL210]|uniref:hypothetical protein n=1 Tax=Vibrio sp. WXL210 TaxID=3450709 RepID=UPI003EC77C34
MSEVYSNLVNALGDECDALWSDFIKETEQTYGPAVARACAPLQTKVRGLYIQLQESGNLSTHQFNVGGAMASIYVTRKKIGGRYVSKIALNDTYL